MRCAAAAVLGVVTLTSLTALTASQPAPATERPSTVRPFDPSTSSGSSRVESRDDGLRVVPSEVEGRPAQGRPEQSRGTRGSGGTERRTEAAVPFKVGETLTYDVSWSSYLVAGTAVTTVTEKRPSYNSTAYYVVVEGRPLPILAKLYNLYYKMDSLVDSRTLLSQRGSLYSEEGKKHQLGATRFDRAARRAFFEHKTDETMTSDFAVPPQTQDGLALLYALRARTYKPGDRVTTPVADGGSLYTVSAAVAALEKVRVPLDEFSAWHLDVSIVDERGQPVWKNIVVWLTNDARRLPVKMQAELPVGQFVLALRHAR